MVNRPSSYAQAPSVQVPDQIASLAANYQLGAFSRCYEAQKPLTILGTGFLIIVVAMLVLGLLLLIAVFLHVAFGFLALFLLLVPILAVAYMIGGLLSSGHKVYIYSNGLIASQGSQTTVLPWNQITQIFHKKSWAATLSSFKPEHIYSLTLHSAQGQTVEISSYMQQVIELGYVIEGEVVRNVFPQVMQRYRSGDTLSFGTFALNMQGITRTTHGDMLPWNEIKSVDYVGEIIAKRGNYGLRLVGVTKNDGRIWAASLETQIPHLALFFQLSREILSSAVY
jgi:hypothetical protein